MEEIPEEITPIIKLTERPDNINIIGKITKKRSIKQLRAFFDDELNRNLAEFTIADESASIFLVVSEDLNNQFNTGDTLLLRNVSTTIFNKHLQLSLKKSSIIKKIQYSLRELNENRNISLKSITERSLGKLQQMEEKQKKFSGPSGGGFKKGGFEK